MLETLVLWKVLLLRTFSVNQRSIAGYNYIFRIENNVAHNLTHLAHNQS